MIKSFQLLKNNQNVSKKLSNKLVIFDKFGTAHLFYCEQEKYFIYHNGRIERDVYFNFIENSKNVDLLDIRLKKFSNLGIGSSIVSLVAQYANQKKKNFRVRLCSNYWLINHLKNNYANAKISIYDYVSESEIIADLSGVNLFEVFEIFLVKLPDETQLYFKYNSNNKNFISLNKDNFELLIDKQEGLLLKKETNLITDFQVYCYNQITTIINNFCGTKNSSKCSKNSY